MKCYYHVGADAVALCKNCSRGVCLSCAATVTNGTACKGRCEAEVEAINALINRNKTSYRKTGTAYSRNAVIYLLLGVFFIVIGGAAYPSLPFLGWYMLPMGGVFLLGAAFNYSTSRKFAEEEPGGGDGA